MARIFAFIAFVLAFCFIQVEAAPLRSRQIGNLQCNLARLRIVSKLRATERALGRVDTTGNTATAAAVADAQDALDEAGAGIRTIAGSLLTGQDAPADARDRVAAGLQGAKTALDSIADTADVADVQKNLADATSAGGDVVAECN